jgi:glycosyltransferase involved in cell wall biosynthesis
MVECEPAARAKTRRRNVLKLLHVAATYLPAVRYGGTIVSVHGLCRALAQRGHHVQVFTTSVDGAEDSCVPHDTPVNIDGVDVWYFRSPRFRRMYWAPAMRRMLREHVGEYDVVHTHGIYLWPLWAAARSAHNAGVPYVVSPRGMLEKDLIEQNSALWKAGLIAFIEKYTLEHAAAVHVTSEREAEQAAAFGFDLPRLSAIPNGVDSSEAAAPPYATAIASIVQGPPFILSLGRLNWKKGLDRLLMALPRIDGARLVIAGNDEDGYREVLQGIANREGVGDRVTFAGPVHGADKAALLSSAQLLVLPSYSENFGNVVLEAMAAGCPVVVTPEVGIAPAVARSGAGAVVDGTPAVLARTIDQLLSNAAERAEMGARGKVAATRYSWAAVAEQMETFYESVAKTRRVHS